MICVNYKGHRCLNEKLPYNEIAQRVYDWDPLNCEFPNRVLIQVWDQHTQDHSATSFYGNSVVPEGVDRSHYITGESLEELTDRVRERLDAYRMHTGNAQLADDFLPNLRATVTRWSKMAKMGVDEDFHRGERQVEHIVFGGPVADEPGKKNALMWPISESGPILRRASDRRDTRYQGRPEDQCRWPGSRRYGSADRRPLRSRQLRCKPLRSSLLGGRRNTRANSRVRISRSTGCRQGSNARVESHHGKRPEEVNLSETSDLTKTLTSLLVSERGDSNGEQRLSRI